MSKFILFYSLATITLVRYYVSGDDDGVFVSDDDGDDAKDDKRNRRSLFGPVKSKWVDAFMKTSYYHAAPGSDIFDFSSENYDLPAGMTQPLPAYDFIVVGAGSAGSVVASRLSRNRNTTVLLLEAGQGETLITDVPGIAPLLQQTKYVWPYLMEEQPGVCMGMKGGRCFWPRGRAVGGSSVVNYMIYTRGLPPDWDRIAADGNYGWSYKEVLPYFLKSEKAKLRKYPNSVFHNRDGELAVEDVPFRSKLSKAFMDAGKLLGHRHVDYNSPDFFGFSYLQATVSKGKRYSAAKAFLHSKKHRPNLHILTNTIATKILINPQTKTAYGVEFHRKKTIYRIEAKKEVILSAGPIESPHLLMLSGIGPKKHLEKIGIPVLQDLNVGGNLYDHIAFPGLAFTLNQTKMTLVESRVASVKNVMQYINFGEGPATSLAGVETIGYIKTNVSKATGDLPDIELLGACASFASDRGNLVAKGVRLEDWLYKDNYKPIENVESFTVMFMLLHPKSKGYMQLRSANPFDYPKLYGNYLQHPQDVATMIAAIRYIIKLVDTPPYKQYGAQLHRKKFPNCIEYEFDSDGYWECAVRTVTSTLHHQIATCKMGPSSDLDAIVDPELRVYGINNLRVVDSSVIPRTIVAHTNAPAIMIGEKGADMIKASWLL